MVFNKNISLALGSGAAKGWAHIGIIKALKELGYKIKAISGTSAGAIIAAYEAFGLLDDFEAFVLNLDKKTALSFYDVNFIPSKGLISGKKLTDLFAEKLENKNIEDAAIPLYICASSLESGQCVTFSKGSVIDAIRASISIPGIFTPVQIKGVFFVDGGVTNPVPVNILSANNHKRIVGVDLNSPLGISNYREMPGIMNTINRSITIMSYYITNINLEKADTWKIIRPNLANYGLFEFHRGTELIEIGYKTALNTFKK